MSFVDVPTTTVVEGDTDPALADRVMAGRLQGVSALQALREARALSTTALARLSGVAHDEIVAAESGKPIGVVERQALAAALDVPAELIKE